jgi:7-carboxy-7-deazaguanine synthase
MDLDAIVSAVNAYPSQYCVLTGGEPMIAKGIHELAAKLRRDEKHITIETAATVPPGNIACDLASLSPKLSNSTPDGNANGWRQRHEEIRLQPKVIAEWIDGYNFQLKFVVTAESDLHEIDELLKLVKRSIPSFKVMLMPEGTDTATIRNHGESLIDVCKRRGYRYCNRLQIDLFGNTRGT